MIEVEHEMVHSHNKIFDQVWKIVTGMNEIPLPIIITFQDIFEQKYPACQSWILIYGLIIEFDMLHG